MQKDCVLFCGGAQLIKPTIAFFACDELADGEESEVDRDGDEGYYGVGQEGNAFKGRVQEEHRVYVICRRFGNEDLEHEVAIKSR